MTREAINLTMSEPLRRAQVRQRLDALAKITGLAQAQLNPAPPETQNL